MAATASSSGDLLYPLPSFYFKVVFTALRGATDSSFQEVRGIGSEIETESVMEGGENRFVHRVPKSVQHPLLELKRGIAPMSSGLVAWCRSTLEAGFTSPISPSMVTVYLLDQFGAPARGWAFANAYPVKWEIDEFKSTKNDVAIETIVLSYTYSNRTL